MTIHAVGEDRLPYLVMEYVTGRSLQEKIDREGQLTLVEILRIGQQVAAGPAAAHAHGLMHRDVKPANILLENGVERVRITDFGLARAAPAADAQGQKRHAFATLSHGFRVCVQGLARHSAAGRSS